MARLGATDYMDTMITTASSMLLLAGIPLAHVEGHDPPLTRVEFERTSISSHVLAYDEAGDVAAEVILWRDADLIRLDAVFPDGLVLAATFDGTEFVVVENTEPATIATRLAAVSDLLAVDQPLIERSWLECGAYAAIAAAELAHANPLGIPTVILAACKCIPEIIDEFEGMECF